MAQSAVAPFPLGAILKVLVGPTSGGLFRFNPVSRLLTEFPGEGEGPTEVRHLPFFQKPVTVERIRRILPLVELDGHSKMGLIALSTPMERDPAALQRSAVWRRSVDVARIAEYVALWAGEGISPEDAYQAGLLHDGALPVMGEEHGNRHAEAGELMARIWGAPDSVCQAIRFHHRADKELLETLEDPRIWLILRLAVFLREALVPKDGAGEENHLTFSPRTSESVVAPLDVLGIKGSDLRDLLEDISRLCGFHSPLIEDAQGRLQALLAKTE
ncbi:MAG: HD domain-containing protein [Magnetococcales bacterium]|nr:HD domain-containing protein [Magnetococcales bacterium]